MPLPRPDDADYQALLDGRVDAEMSDAEECRRLSQQAADSWGEHQVEVGKGGRRSKLSTVAGYIILTEFCERLAYYGFSGRFPPPVLAVGLVWFIKSAVFECGTTAACTFPETLLAHAVFCAIFRVMRELVRARSRCHLRSQADFIIFTCAMCVSNSNDNFCLCALSLSLSSKRGSTFNSAPC